MTKIKLNGADFELGAVKASIANLVQKLDLENKRFAVEVNEEIVSRSEHETYILQDQDKVEIVQAIGGG